MSSISCLDNNKIKVQEAPENSLDLPDVVHSDKEQVEESVETEQQPVNNEGPKACEDPRFIRFFKMVQFGVPAAAVKQKMETEGFDPGVLE